MIPCRNTGDFFVLQYEKTYLFNIDKGMCIDLMIVCHKLTNVRGSAMLRTKNLCFIKEVFLCLTVHY